MGSGKLSAKSSSHDVRDYLTTLDKETLIDLVLQSMRESEGFGSRLRLKIAEWKGGSSAAKIWKESFGAATYVHGFVDYHEMSSFASDIENHLDQLDEWNRKGKATEVVELAEYAVTKVEKAIEYCDDSDGYFSDILAHVASIHLEACEKSLPEPVALARRLFTMELKEQWGTFAKTVERYQKVLGKEGVELFRELAGKEWAKIVPTTPGAGRHGYDPHRSRVTSMMEALARIDGDTEALVAVMSRDLGSESDFLRIVEVYRKAGDRDKALAWAERGAKVFSVSFRGGLREYLIDENLRRKRGPEALKIAWPIYSASPHHSKEIILIPPPIRASRIRFILPRRP